MSLFTTKDNYEDIAYTIFHEFKIEQSCGIVGWITVRDEVKPLGELVVEELRKLDSIHNTSDGKRRHRKVLPDSIGGFVAQKIFKFKKVKDNNHYKYTIWRVQ